MSNLKMNGYAYGRKYGRFLSECANKNRKGMFYTCIFVHIHNVTKGNFLIKNVKRNWSRFKMV